MTIYNLGLRVGLAATLLAQPATQLFAQRSLTEINANNRTASVMQSIVNGRAKNVIMFLGDGMGDSEITIARNYQVGANGRLSMDNLPLTGAYTTYALSETNPDQPDYVTDSAASGTGWATGFKTSNGRISTVARSTNVAPYTTILELAQKAGYSTGDVTTAELTDATPAVLAAHINDRGCQGPANMATCGVYRKSNGGPGSIAEQMVDHKVDVLMGGAFARFAQTIAGGPFDGQTVLGEAQAQGYTLVRNTNELRNINNQQVLGLFNDGNMSLEWRGAIAGVFPGTGPQTCVTDQRPASEPSLEEMTTKAISVLEKRSSKGFYLQVEGASIDKQDHLSNPCGQIGETIAFDKAVQVGLDYAKAHPDTLVIVTADHAHTSQIIDPPTSAAQPGAFSILLTKDGAPMTVSYASTPVGTSQSHTGAQVRIAAQGPQAANVVGVTNQTDLFFTVARALGILDN